VLPETHPLIESVTKPLADNAEQRLAANALLGENFNPDHPGVEEALARLLVDDGKRHPAAWKVALWVLAGIALALALFSHLPEIRLADSVFGSSLFEPPEPPPLPSGLTERERLLLGDPALDDLEQKRRLHLHEPGNPAYYVEYVGAYGFENEGLPPGYMETVARIAPDNAFFLYFAAGKIGKKSFVKERSSAGPSKPRVIDGVNLGPAFREQEFSITDRAAFDEAMALIRKAAELPDFQTYTNTMMVERSGIPPDDTMAEFIHSLVHVYSPAGGIIGLRIVADLLNAGAYDLSNKGRKEDLIALTRQREAFMTGLSRNDDTTLVGELVYAVIGSATAVNFHAAADRLGLGDLAETYRIQTDSFQKMKDSRNIRRKNDTEPFPEEHAAIMAGLSLPMVSAQVFSPLPISKSDLKPMRLAEHEVASRLGITSAALILLIACLPVFLFRFLSPRPVRLTAKRLAILLRPGDWVWVFLCGIVLPLTIFLAISRMTPLGGRDYGLKHFLLLFPGIHLLAILMNLLLAPALLIRWRLSKRLAPFGIGSGGGRISGVILLAILLWSLVAYPVLVRFGLAVPALIGLSAVPLLWVGNVFLNVMQAILGKPRQRIVSTATSAALPPAYAMGIIALCLCLPIFIASEKDWLAQDTLFRTAPDAPDLGAYEFKVAAEKRREINAILGFE
jgi:hypothetical protein